MNTEELVKAAQDGDKQALESLVRAIQDDVYYLSLRMLYEPADAKDATQEILVRVITKLSTFQFDSAFKTWVFRVATNYLLDSKRARARRREWSFDDFRADLEDNLEEPGELATTAEYPLLLNEVRIACTTAMLLCLDQKHRMAYILGDIFELNHAEASEVLGISKENYRQQLARARAKVESFTQRSCGIVSAQAKCGCDRKVKSALRLGRVDPNHTDRATKSDASYAEIEQRIRETQTDLRTLALQRTVPRFESPVNFGQLIEELVKQAEHRSGC